jgi:hypothetical protein
MDTVQLPPTVGERRGFVRVPSCCRVEVETIHFAAKGVAGLWGEVKNIGAGGICFVCDSRCRVADLLKVTIHLDGWRKQHEQHFGVYDEDFSSPVTAICRALRVDRVEEGRCEIAAKFEDVYQDDLSRLKRFVELEAQRIGVTA